jgi:hypothetical protein
MYGRSICEMWEPKVVFDVPYSSKAEENPITYPKDRRDFGRIALIHLMNTRLL